MSIKNQRYFRVVDVRANSFPPIDSKRQKSELTYHLYIDNDDELQERSEFFTINEKTGDVILMKELDYDDRTQMKVHRLRGMMMA